jgi:hypothetical protein
VTRMKNWIPEICYEEDPSGLSSHIPFIEVPKDQEMPRFLFVFESRETGEYEPGDDGSPLPIYDMDLHQYANMAALKQGLSSEAFDQVRAVLGLEPLEIAQEKGKKISEKIRKNLD